jgi:hypothetical protein
MIVPQLIKNFPAFYESLRCASVFIVLLFDTGPHLRSQSAFSRAAQITFYLSFRLYYAVLKHVQSLSCLASKRATFTKPALSTLEQNAFRNTVTKQKN